jgi:hypothetical protein
MRAAILSVLVLAAVPAAAQDWVRHRDAAGGYSLAAPPGWQAVQPDAAHVGLLLRPPDRHPSGPAECTASHRAEPALRGFTQAQIDAAAAAVPMSEQEARESLGADGPGAAIRDRRIVRLAGLPAQSFAYEATFDVPGGRIGAAGRVVILHRPEGVTALNCTAFGRDLPAARRGLAAWQAEIAGLFGSLAFD